ncbi:MULTISPECIES: DUF1868 domain-containing protein [Spirulina sp. CCY15215]|uniref:DUF1868 domain-containing protein n=1 Tax=Spirulina sp. CCY15215 TaxID=2767591 RepID=UPI00194E11D3|nr:DUF1868 domain-containing protein [Spirulina major]
MDETYQTYLNRVTKLTRPAICRTQLQNVQESPKFKQGKAIAFPGYAVSSATGNLDKNNELFYKELATARSQLLEQLGEGLLIPVPADSFHLTIADLIWDGNYRDAIAEDEEFELKLRDRVSHSFDQYQQSIPDRRPISWQLLGIGVRPRAIEVYLVSKDEESYFKLLQLRRAIYQNRGLIALGVQQQYHYTAHITLGYFGARVETFDRDNFCDIITDFNDRWTDTDKILTLDRAELQKFDDMTRFYKEPSFPSVEF